MGCSTSKPVGDDTRAPRPAKNIQESDNSRFDDLVLTEVSWERDEAWTKWICDNEKQAIKADRHEEFLERFRDIMYLGVRGRFNKMYPECEANGTMDDLEQPHVCSSIGPCSGDDGFEWSTRGVTVVDAEFSGNVLAFAIMVAKPPQRPDVMDEKQQQSVDHSQPWLVPGAELDSPEMRSAKHAIVQKAAFMKSNGAKVSHSLIYVFVGADLVVCRFDSSPKPPTITPHTVKLPKIVIYTVNAIAKDARSSPDLFRGRWAPQQFRQAVRDMADGFEGSTVWDEGPLPFMLPNGRMYHEPTRLLVTRVYEKMTETVEEVSFTAAPPLFPGEDTPRDPMTLVRKADPTKEPGGIVRIALIIGINKNIIWPKMGDYAKTSTMAAGEKAAVEYAKGLYEKGALDRCNISIYMGTDESVFRLVGDPKTLTPRGRRLPLPSELGNPTKIAASPGVPQDPWEDRTLERDFNLSISIQPKHDLMASESNFQAIKQYMIDKSKDKTPEELYDQAMRAMPMAAKHILESNFPECEVTDEGPFPIVLPDGTETVDPEARLVVARDSKQEPSSIVAAVHVVPCPSGLHGEFNMYSDKNWLETPEMKAADQRLLELLKRWHVQGKVSKVDCMAQTMMVKDVTVYKFVDGERFEDYSEERMQQLRWG
ncbi:uncharacterized protein FTOL_07267 [Fusarium torulosum]|uniref:Uncharacterized protein n=1 Tax=Fusarium torulosum TaxID=33205 RepID=A0AAE8SJ69_9HYPO|nr:uncharacterized protein FTOL_07267 [Fusarium torulosum]